LTTSAQITVISAQKHFFWNGCMAVAQFSFPLGSLQLESAKAAINDVSLLGLPPRTINQNTYPD
jgi:hypothetical protein